MADIQFEIHITGADINLVVPKQEGLSFEDAAPRLAAYAERLALQSGKRVTIQSAPERHLHGPDTHLHFGQGTRTHSHS